MPRRDTAIECEATLLRPATPKQARWGFIVLPKAASARLPTRSMTTVEGTLAGVPFEAVLEPDGQGSHWFKVPAALQSRAGLSTGDRVSLALKPSARTPEPRVPADLRAALASSAAAAAQWNSLTPVARRDWVQWLDSSKKAETRAKRVASSVDMLECGKRRVCCFDRSGIYSKAFSAPEAAS